MSDTERITGKLYKKLDKFGFILGEDKIEYFLLPSNLDRMAGVRYEDLKKGDKLQFTPIVHPKGPRAIEVKRVR